MKFLNLFFLTLILSSYFENTYAQQDFNDTVYSISCQLPENEFVHRFQSIGYISVDKDGVVKGVFSFQMIKGDEIRSVIQLNDLNAEGTLESYGPTDSQPEGFKILTLLVDHPYLKSVNLIFKNSDLASQVTSIDNFSYRSNCKLIQ
jgi:hypothetical protein